MVDVVSNKNESLKVPKLNVGILPVPNKLHRPHLFNPKEASERFKKLDEDIFQEKEKISYEKTKKTPIGVIALAVAGVLAIAGQLTGVIPTFRKIMK